MCRVRGFSKILWCWCAPHVHVANLCSFRALTGHFRFVKRWRRPVERPHSWLFGLGGKMILDGCAIVVLEVVTPEMRKSTEVTLDDLALAHKMDCQEESEESGDERRKERPVLAEEQGQDMPVDIGSIELDSDAEVLENFEKLLRLEELFLGKNKITKLQNLDYFANLMVLSLQSNRLTKIEGLRFLVNLQELYLSHNGIEIIEGLENNRKLTTLDIASNRIKKIENLNHLVHLQEFWMNDNLISNWNDLDELNNAKELQTIYLERNPLHQDPQYRRKIMLVLPWVQQIDATFVRI
uniref:protein phosphatase 1 regulatory subunit 7 isoform X8 n=1 Tax=Myxine glutinosa TaxID=7769 RepID=UPI00358F8423